MGPGRAINQNGSAGKGQQIFIGMGWTGMAE
jgi:hypothetical protein